MNIYINILQLEKLVKEARKNPLYDEIYSLAKDKYVLGLGNEKPENIYETAFRINQRQNDKGDHDYKRKVQRNLKRQFWAFGEFKIFSWVSVYYCYSKSIQLSNMRENDFRYVQSIFTHKNLMFIKYETYCLAYSKQKIKEQWNEQQKKILNEVIDRFQIKGNWRQVSFELFSISQGRFFRSLQQCREKWTNYLNPIVKKGDWELDEDIKLFNLAAIYRCKWASISRQFNGARTEHMVKNRYNSYIRNWKNKNNKRISQQQIEGKIIAYLKKKSLKRQCYKLSNQKGILNNLEDSMQEQGSQYHFCYSKESQGQEQDSFLYMNQMMERVQAQKYEKQEKKTREDENQDIQIHFYCGTMDYEIFSETYTDKLKIQAEIPTQQSKSYICPIQVNNSSNLFGKEEINYLVSALGCCHYERIDNNDWLMNQLQERHNLDWIQ